MTSAQWFLLAGGPLLASGLTAPLLQFLPVTSAIAGLPGSQCGASARQAACHGAEAIPGQVIAATLTAWQQA